MVGLDAMIACERLFGQDRGGAMLDLVDGRCPEVGRDCRCRDGGSETWQSRTSQLNEWTPRRTRQKDERSRLSLYFLKNWSIGKGEHEDPVRNTR
jgi:hypothetical protein